MFVKARSGRMNDLRWLLSQLGKTHAELNIFTFFETLVLVFFVFNT